MRTLTRLDSNPKQVIYFTTEDKQRIKFYFYFLLTQQGWFVDIEVDDFKLYGTRLCVLPNLLEKYSNIIDWGLNVWTKDGIDPFQVTDFSTGYCEVSVLDKSEVQYVKDVLNGKIEPNL